MISVSQQQMAKRWNTLSPQLREAIFSDANDDFILKLCQAEHFSDEKCDEVFGAASLVLFGFLHPEDLADELKNAAGLNPQIAATISNGINQRIFTPLKDDINKVFAPLSKLDGKPKILQEIKPAIITTASEPKLVPSGIIGVPPPSTPPKPSGAGWSRSTPDQPVVKLSQASVPPPQNIVSSRVPPPAPKPAAIPIKGSVGEFERMAIQKGAPQAPVAPAGPAPVIIHEDASFRPAQQPPNFHLRLPVEQFNMQKGTTPTPMRPAVLELGNAAPGAAARVVHYTEYKSPSPVTPVTPKMPPAQQGSRQITEVMPQSVPRPPSPPTPVTANSPTPTIPATKMIYKDYSASPAQNPPPLPAPPPLPPQKTN